MSLFNQGEAIQLLEERENQAHAESKLSLGQCYRITDYTCTTPDKYQKILDNPVHMNIGEASTIESISDTVLLPTHWFHFRPRSHFQIIADKNVDYPGKIINFRY